MIRIVTVGASALVLCASAGAVAQQSLGAVPQLNALTQNEYTFDTLEQGKIRVSVIVRGLKSPWPLAFMPAGDALISERGGDLRVVHDVTSTAGDAVTLDPRPVSGLPKVELPVNRAGLHDVVARFA